MGDLLWPTYDGPGDLAAIEAVPLADRGLPGTTYELLVRAAGLWPDRVALSVLPDGDRWEQPSERTFAELLADVHRYANVFHALGVRRTDGVALLAPNCDELITATLAAELAGIAAPINSGLSGEHIAELLRRSGARVLVAAGPDLAPEVWDHARNARPRGRDRGPARAAPDRGEGGGGGAAPDRRRAGRPPVRAGGGAATRPLRGGAALGHRPRRSLPHRWYDRHAEARSAHPRQRGHRRLDDRRDRGAGHASQWSSPRCRSSTSTPWSSPLLAPLFKGQRVVWAGPLGYRDTQLFANFWKVVERYRISFMSGVPTIYAVLAERPVDADISSLRFALVGASPLPKAVRERFESATGVPLMEGYGLTEATCASARSFVDHPVPGSVGQRLPYQQVKTIEVNAEGEWVDLPTGEVGVLAIGGPTVFPGYVVDRGPDGPVLDGLGKLRERLAGHR